MDQFGKKFVEDLSHGAPHVFILGAGASRACCPNGDKNGKKLPLMRELIEVVGLDDLLGSDTRGKNIEKIYTDYNNSKLILGIENKIRNYFSSLELPDKPTIYDHLLLSLREKDLIATFNWDPLLFQACKRNFKKTKLPYIVYLHGNVAIGYCDICRVTGPVEGKCHCNKKYKPSKLLYPIEEKNYDSDPLIKSAWITINQYLKRAYILTIFGYGAPKSDYKAMQLFKNAWGPSEERELEEIEIIHSPKSNKEKAIMPWQYFIHSHHYGTFDSFYNSYVAHYPRR